MMMSTSSNGVDACSPTAHSSRVKYSCLALLLLLQVVYAS